MAQHSAVAAATSAATNTLLLQDMKKIFDKLSEFTADMSRILSQHIDAGSQAHQQPLQVGNGVGSMPSLPSASVTSMVPPAASLNITGSSAAHAAATGGARGQSQPFDGVGLSHGIELFF